MTMLRTRFLQDPFTLRHVLDLEGCLSISDLVLKRCGDGGPYTRALSLLCRDGAQDRNFILAGLAETIIGVDESPNMIISAKSVPSDQITYFNPPLSKIDLNEPVSLVYSFDSLADAEDLEGALELAWRVLRPGAAFAVIGYFESKNGPSDQDLAAMLPLLSSVPPKLLSAPDGEIEERIRLLISEVTPRHSGDVLKAAIEARFGNYETVELGSFLPYLLWRCTLGSLSYESDANVSLVLMTQVIERQLIQSRIIQPSLKLLIARKMSIRQ
ncbi:class I SAM-dependent methyltransferase [Methylobacterium sp. M6A4_1b]